ncbi:hypothetical protein JCM19235_2767 [Vibrio maritimus]|uniref:Uncharacterized protein n=1 Tax=Vibrio maritimus TaxID=990268 RepID=A0A090S5K4_9VIBR|nr:hypothetical protein JCM19235_2767 [Vibrio maritimus]
MARAWLLMCIASLISFNTLSVKIHLDGTQKQVLLKKIELISAVIYALSLIVLIKSNLDLYSVGLASSISSMSTVCMFIAIGYKDKIKQAISNFKFKNFKNTFREVFPLFKRTIFVWVSGYIFWNSFNIISLRVMGVVYTGQIGLTISLFRAGLNVSLSIVIGQMTAYAKLISSGSEEIARKSFVKYLAISSLILVSGYSLFTILYHMSYLGEFGSKLLPIGELKYITIFFLFTFIATALNNYVRCFKIEPFVTLSAFNAFATSLAFYYSLLYSSSGFTYVVLVSLVVCCWSFYIFVDKIKGSNE